MGVLEVFTDPFMDCYESVRKTYFKARYGVDADTFKKHVS